MWVCYCWFLVNFSVQSTYINFSFSVNSNSFSTCSGQRAWISSSACAQVDRCQFFAPISVKYEELRDLLVGGCTAPGSAMLGCIMECKQTWFTPCSHKRFFFVLFFFFQSVIFYCGSPKKLIHLSLSKQFLDMTARSWCK